MKVGQQEKAVKVELIKPQKPKQTESTETTTEQVQVQTASASPKRVSAEAKRQRQQAERWQEGHPGLRRVYFVIDEGLWDRFLRVCCATQKPNAVFTQMIREAVQAQGPAVSPESEG